MTEQLLCFNCDKPLIKPTLYCSPLCQEEGKTIRYVRAVMRDGRIKHPDVKEAVRFRMAMLLAGGYPRLQRRVAQEVREFVFERDGGRCQVCGEKATEIHHLDHTLAGNVNEAPNLQAICGPCHRKETMSRFKPAGPEHRRKAAVYQLRIRSREPLRLSDDEIDRRLLARMGANPDEVSGTRSGCRRRRALGPRPRRRARPAAGRPA